MIQQVLCFLTDLLARTVNFTSFDLNLAAVVDLQKTGLKKSRCTPPITVLRIAAHVSSSGVSQVATPFQFGERRAVAVDIVNYLCWSRRGRMGWSFNSCTNSTRPSVAAARNCSPFSTVAFVASPITPLAVCWLQ